MSLIITTFVPDAIILCADRQAHHSKTNEVQPFSVEKISWWTPSLAVGAVGSLYLIDIISSAVKEVVKELDPCEITLEEITDLICEGYNVAREIYEDIPKEAAVKFIVAGIFSDGEVAGVQIFARNDEVISEKIVYDGISATLTFHRQI